MHGEDGTFRPVLLVPVYNGRPIFLKLLPQILHHHPGAVVVVDDGSTDGLNSTDVEPAVYLRHDQNLGKGAAIQTGLNWARRMGYTHALTLDADGQHPPERIPSFWKLCRFFQTSLIIARRKWTPRNMPLHRIASNTITSMGLSLRSGVRIPDSQVGMRIYPLRNPALWETRSGGFQFESEVLLRGARLGYSLRTVAIPVIYGPETSHIRNVGDTLRFIQLFLRSFLG